ncbi:MAG: Arabinose 5-phosphate isomerase KdsD [candidate division TA06 bacterium ADurb.Bin417]|uniref:Arabinose 5-phosphate isomerase KdsD n=1 Tax=candidate division TA06 bacterium ADurb.Bin417 TaxID=1852828 RepID=A0A1V5MBW6_UNCT6|nr:MAG: Arabinose 5-phosphate isomerase KdsD [candidate division TA06 bacterium ADurb.Bin417]
MLETRAVNEADRFDVIPTASTTALLVLGDALAVCTLERKGFQRRDYAFLHPAGALGQQLTRLVDDLMRPASKMPRVSEGVPLSAALKTMSQGDLGLVVVTDADGLLAGILTDGDLRRHLIEKDSIKDFRVEDLMTRKPKTIKAGSLAVNAVRIMEKHEITALIVVDRGNRPVGVIHLHGILGGKRLYGKG